MMKSEQNPPILNREAYFRGFNDQLAGLQKSDCPHCQGDMANRRAWMRGWDDAVASGTED